MNDATLWAIAFNLACLNVQLTLLIAAIRSK